MKDVKGLLFLVRRSQAPNFLFLLLDRQQLKTFVEEISSQLCAPPFKLDPIFSLVLVSFRDDVECRGWHGDLPVLVRSIRDY